MDTNLQKSLSVKLLSGELQQQQHCVMSQGVVLTTYINTKCNVNVVLLS